MSQAPFESGIAEMIWDSRYRHRVDGVIRDLAPLSGLERESD